MSCELQVPVQPNEGKGALIRKPERTTLTSLLSTGLSRLWCVCVCVCVCAHGHMYPRCLDGSEGPQYQIFQLFLHVNTHPARSQGVYRAGD